jgi:RNA polymerase sigma-70 factor (ECF subfamily)
VLFAMLASLGGPPEERETLARAQAGDAAAFAALHRRLHRPMGVVAARYLRDPEAVAEIVQDTWEAVIRGQAAFEGRSKLSTWVFSIVANKARTRATRDQRWTPLSAVEPELAGPDSLADSFRADGHWLVAPAPWTRRADELLAERGAITALRGFLEALPAAQRAAVTLRDVEGEEPAAICALLGVSDGNLRVLLHRGRLRLRAQLEEWAR